MKLHGIQSHRSSARSGGSNADKLMIMSNYCSSNPTIIQCRRRYLLDYFGDSLQSPLSIDGIDCCDLCQKKEANKVATNSSSPCEGVGWVTRNGACDLSAFTDVDLSHEILLLLRAVQECGGYFGLNATVGLVVGSRDKSLQKIPGQLLADVAHTFNYDAILDEIVVFTLLFLCVCAKATPITCAPLGWVRGTPRRGGLS